MLFEHPPHSTKPDFSAHIAATTNDSNDTTVAHFEDRLWTAAEAVIGAGAPSIGFVAEAASIVRRQSETFAAVISGDVNAALAGGKTASGDDIASAEDRLIAQLRRELSKVDHGRKN